MMHIWAEYVPPETEYEPFMFEIELLNLNYCLKNRIWITNF